jgi:FkbM family methyltransferase
MPDHGLIYDIGLHRGDDTEFYLKKGFRVIAVEANPKLIEHARTRFAPQLASGQLKLVHAAMAAFKGEVEFYVNLDKDDWSSMDPAYGARMNTRFEKIRVPAMPFADLLDRHSVPHYIKCDIEGGDMDVLQSMLRNSARPKYFSVEAHDLAYYALLSAMGYTRFKLVNQNLNWATKLPSPAAEGESVEHVFAGDCSGPFGKESVGDWCTLDEVLQADQAVRTIAKFPWMSNAWFDIHARLPEPEDNAKKHEDKPNEFAHADPWALAKT